MTDYGNPDHDPTPAPIAAITATEAIESALIDAKGTIEAKANHVYGHLVAGGWALAKPDAGGRLVELLPGQQVVEVPDGATVSIHPPGEFALYGPAVPGNDELGFLSVVCEHLDRMAPDARGRCTAYLTDRFGPLDGAR